MGILSLLTVLFVGLRLANIIAWSWIWVLSPLWLEGIFWLLVIALAGGYTLLKVFLRRGK